MGLGGHLIWTTVAESLYAHSGQKPILCYKPLLSDLFRGSLYNRNMSAESSPVFLNNPHIAITKKIKKSKLEKVIDALFKVILKNQKINAYYENIIFKKVESQYQSSKNRYLHIDMIKHSYAEKEFKKRFIWKKGGHVSEVIARNFGIAINKIRTWMYFTEDEHLALKKMLELNAIDQKFIVVEPSTNAEWFGQLRSWPFERWQQLIKNIKLKYPDLAIVQVGLKDAPQLEGVISLCGKTSFRDAALLMKHSSLFLGTEGGLMHAASAVDVPALILWGGLTLPEFAGYPKQHTIICKYVECSSCGHKGWCNNNIKCMKSITVEEVFSQFQLLQSDMKQLVS